MIGSTPFSLTKKLKKMPDITMCKGLKCPSKEKCYRFKAKPTEHRQSYFANTPKLNKDGKCDYFYPLK